MADEEELDLGFDTEQENINNRVEKRIKSLSEKVKLTSEERDEVKRLNESLTSEKHNLSKERDFYKGFNQVSAKYPSASEYQDKILEKVNAGYDLEDAAVAVLNKEGKFTPAPPVQEKFTAAGGSASTGIADNVEKTPDKMLQSERLAVLKEMESKGEFKF